MNCVFFEGVFICQITPIIRNKLSVAKILLSLAISISVGNCMNKEKTESQVMSSSIWRPIMPQNAQTQIIQYPVNNTANSPTIRINNNSAFKPINAPGNNPNINWNNAHLLDLFNNNLLSNQNSVPINTKNLLGKKKSIENSSIERNKNKIIMQ